MTSLITQWQRLQNWLKNLLQTPDATLPAATMEPARQTTPTKRLTSFFRREKVVITYHSGEIIKLDGLVLKGTAYVDESAIAGVSAPAFIDASSAQCNVFAGTLVTEGCITVESDAPEVENELEDLRDSRHTIRVNLAILEKEIAELKGIAKRTPASADVTAAKALLETAQNALMLEFALSTASSKQLGEILGQVFEAMNQSNRARHLLNACM
jgi:hypothetical protein